MRLIDEEGKQAGVLSLEKARELAVQRGFDLLLVSDSTNPPVCKLIDIGQFKYQQQKKDKQNRKNTKSQVTKELKMGPKISVNDYQVKVNKGREFLEKGYKVKLSVNFRGREIMHMDLGRTLLLKYLEQIQDICSANASEIASAHKSLMVILNPK